MKGLAIDSAISRLSICAKNDDKTAEIILDIGNRLTEKIVTTVEYALKQVDLEFKDLEYVAISNGPGSFTGLRVAFSFAKALTLSHNIPCYAVDTLDLYSYALKDLNYPVLSVIDAKKNKFYAKLIDASCNASNKENSCLLPSGDYEIEQIINKINECNIKTLIVSGEDARLFIERVKGDDEICDLTLLKINNSVTYAQSLHSIALELIEKNAPPLSDFASPEYLRASEAEENLNLTTS